MGTILLFYKYVAIQYPKQVQNWQRALCQKLGLKGRIIIAHEGINGTVGGTTESTQAYSEALKAHPLFCDIDIKTNPGSHDHFPRLRIVVRQEIVTTGMPATITTEQGGTHLEPRQAHELITQHPENLVLFDTRNWYESNVGTFVGAVTPNINYFRDLPRYIDEHLDQFANKQVLMFCTGGIRCERASAYLNTKNVAKNVYQIKGGIHRYIEQFPDGYFRGKNYVFDGRITHKVNDDVLSTCHLCATPCDNYTNCVNAVCNRQFVCCTPCFEQSKSFCSPSCKESVAQHKAPLRTKPAKAIQGSSCSL